VAATIMHIGKEDSEMNLADLAIDEDAIMSEEMGLACLAFYVVIYVYILWDKSTTVCFDTS